MASVEKDKSTADRALSKPSSFKLADGAFIRGDVAVLRNGVMMRGKKKVFKVHPEDVASGEVVGRGASALVVKGLHRPTGTQLALKNMSIAGSASRAQLVKEISALYDANCECLVTFHGAYYKEGTITIALEYMDGGSIESLVKQRGPMSDLALASSAFQCLWGLNYMRHEKRLHRDLKPNNILCSTDGSVKLTDFGISSELKSSMAMAKTMLGSTLYMSPERLRNESYSFPADMWSIGLTIFACAVGKNPYGEFANQLEVMDAVVNGPVPDPSRFRGCGGRGLSPGCVRVIQKCMQKDPAMRSDADSLLGDPWFAGHGIANVERARAAMRHAVGWGEGKAEGGAPSRESKSPALPPARAMGGIGSSAAGGAGAGAGSWGSGGAATGGSAAMDGGSCPSSLAAAKAVPRICMGSPYLAGGAGSMARPGLHPAGRLSARGIGNGPGHHGASTGIGSHAPRPGSGGAGAGASIGGGVTGQIGMDDGELL